MGGTMAIAQGIIGASQASAANDAIGNAVNNQRRALMIQQAQLTAQNAQQKQNELESRRRALGRLRAASALAGLSVAGTPDALAGAEVAAAAADQNTLSQNVRMALQSAGSQTAANIDGLNSRRQSVFMSAFQGAMNGLSQGMQISSGINSAMGGP